MDRLEFFRRQTVIDEADRTARLADLLDIAVSFITADKDQPVCHSLQEPLQKEEEAAFHGGCIVMDAAAMWTIKTGNATT